MDKRLAYNLDFRGPHDDDGPPRDPLDPAGSQGLDL